MTRFRNPPDPRNLEAKTPESKTFASRPSDEPGSVDTSSAEASTEAMARLEVQIDGLYEELHRLGSRPASKKTDRTIRAKLARLRELQTREAEAFRKAFEASLEMPIDAGRTLLAHVRELRARFEDPASDDATAARALHPPASATSG